MDAVLLRPQLSAGTITQDLYQRTIGAASTWPLTNIGFIVQTNSDTPGRTSLGTHDQNKMIQAFKQMDFIVAPVYHITNPQAFYADILLPLADNHFEDFMGYARGSGMTNYFFCGFKQVQWPAKQGRLNGLT